MEEDYPINALCAAFDVNRAGYYAWLERRYSTRQRVDARLVCAYGLRAQAASSFVPRTTDSRHDEPVAPNLFTGCAGSDGPDQVWLRDITYILTEQG